MLHRRQFIVSRQAQEIGAAIGTDWVVRDIGGLVLSHAPDLPVERVLGADGTVWHLLGLAVQTDPARLDPAEALAGARFDTIGETHRSWAGRWVLLNNRAVHMDAGGTLGVFYGEVDGGLVLSSSAALMAELLGDKAEFRRRLTHEAGLDWYPLPGSGLKGVRRLLPTQVLNPSRRIGEEGFLTFRRPFAPVLPGFSDEQAMERMERILVTAVRNLHRAVGRPLMLQLTAGFDTRLLLATARKAEVPFATFTFDHKDLTPGDRKLPPKLAQIAGVEHKLIHCGPIDRQRARDYLAHTGRHTAALDGEFHSNGAWDGVPEGSTVLHGGVFEVARCFYWGQIPPGLTADGEDTAARLFDSFRGKLYNPLSHYDSLREWLDWVVRTPELAMDLRDRFYLEQRVAGWLSAIDQGVDLTGRQLFQPGNCADFMAVALALPVDVRRASRHHAELIRRMAPELLSEPINPPQPAVLRQLRKLPRRLNKLRTAIGHHLMRKSA
ncbi:asparagine synthetase B family protein [Azospirillum canadense]|uniref:hypothetical protein n=1 Tax=Azospirillum canadense TaxID=403962 RepID=UPI002226B57A|nr:hypothetical protein [Azospirillum canadense]MCW2235845.1 hypothetical protein [Azospirillum canadense]